MACKTYLPDPSTLDITCAALTSDCSNRRFLDHALHPYAFTYFCDAHRKRWPQSVSLPVNLETELLTSRRSISPESQKCPQCRRYYALHEHFPPLEQDFHLGPWNSSPWSYLASPKWFCCHPVEKSLLRANKKKEEKQTKKGDERKKRNETTCGAQTREINAGSSWGRNPVAPNMYRLRP